ncbi:unnamed protein product, partial [marine sediment metagenome]
NAALGRALTLEETAQVDTGTDAFGVNDTIDFDAALSGGTILLTMGQMGITDSLTIDASSLASGLTIDASGNDPTPDENNGDGSRIFNINDGDSATKLSVELRSLTLTGGDVAGGGGAIFSQEHLSVIDSTILGNSAGSGGGIFANRGTTNITDSTISGNSAGGDGGGISAYAYFSSFTLNITDSTISGNSAGGDGGGISYATLLCTLNITDSTISGNSSGGWGGGIYAVNGTTNITGSTISGNSANFSGGGIRSTRTTNITGSTIYGNRADADDNGFGAAGGLSGTAAGSILDHTIVAGNLRGLATHDDIKGLIDATYSLVGDDTGATITDNGGNLIGTSGAPIDPLLGPLDDNGGPTETHALLVGSPAIDAGDMNAMAGVDDVPLYDQRG